MIVVCYSPDKGVLFAEIGHDEEECNGIIFSSIIDLIKDHQKEKAPAPNVNFRIETDALGKWIYKVIIDYREEYIYKILTQN